MVQQEPRYVFCLGATKAGTTWAHDQLARHPECHFRSIKEFHYFTMTKPAHFVAKMADTEAEIARLRAAPSPRLADLQAWAKVLAKGQIDLPAYRAFMATGLGAAQVVGDFTPAYSLMPKDQISALAALGDDVRFFYLLRDPVARLWSHVRMVAARSGAAGFAARAESLMAAICAGSTEGEAKGIVKRGDYAHIVQKLRRALDPSRLLLTYYEDVTGSAGFARLLAFLGLSPMAAQSDKPVHQGQPLDLPAPLHGAALRFLRPQYDFVATHLPDLPQAWRRNMEGFAL